ncbi:MAG: aspartate aminotransferase family protein [Desulfococcus sp. 4484_242]|nr:MAG: aspartate aminotransferase family protein [Desulfococcus sp. 4484_242]
MDIASLIQSRLSETYELHRRYVNPQFVRVLEVIGFNRNYCRARGATLIDEKGREVLDFLAGFGVFNIGRNHPVVAQVIQDMLHCSAPNLVQMDVGVVSGLLAEALARITPTELNVTLGALSVNGNEEFRSRNEPLLPGCIPVPFNDLNALEAALSAGDAAAFIAEPIQGKGVFVPDDDYFPGVRRLCDRYGTLFIADEVQTGFGRTGRMFALNHWDVTPDILVVSKALSGGYIPLGAIITKRAIHSRVFDCMDRCFAHSNTFGQNNLAMAAGLATLDVIEQENLIDRSARLGNYLMKGLNDMAARYELLHQVRGKGLMIGIQFGPPRSLSLKTGWKLLHKMNEELFCQMITIPLLERHHILTQVAGHGLDTVKILPPLIIDTADADRFLNAMDDVLKDAHKFPGSAWTTVKNLGLRTAKTA